MPDASCQIPTPMTNDQLRQALGELNGQRDAVFTFEGETDRCVVTDAMLVPAEDDQLVKVSDGKHVYIIDAERVAWIRIG